MRQNAKKSSAKKINSIVIISILKFNIEKLIFIKVEKNKFATKIDKSSFFNFLEKFNLNLSKTFKLLCYAFVII